MGCGLSKTDIHEAVLQIASHSEAQSKAIAELREKIASIETRLNGTYACNCAQN